ncbi:hypothetical protein CHS0354_001190 [Potamilus streckersoni]|uniref:D-isomer specific 2-hydroxyacid dehydrogenase catalytic domain-containing protein n=1 Tax=Potamilus streckersoni TaxID=2493646 RepID=A0AAE0RMG6_9BIVA|nr:hypothetical protein CHS0354_001190 [Potamilus streckersoni]
MSSAGKKVYITRRVPQPGFDILKNAGCEISIWDSDEAIPKEELLNNVPGIDGLFCMLTDPIDVEILNAAGKKVYITRRIPQPGFDILKNAGCEISIWDSDEAIPKEELLNNVPGIDGLFCMLTDPIDVEILNAAGLYTSA